MRKRIQVSTFFVFLLASSFCHSQIDSYSWCQRHMDAIRSLSTEEMEFLLEKRRNISFSNSIESFSKATGKNYEELVQIYMRTEGKTQEIAEKLVMENIKPYEIYMVNTAIEMHGITDEKSWLEWYKSCVAQKL